MSATLHIPTLAHDIAEYIRTERLLPGTRLPGRKLADVFRVSRTPIDRALRLLQQHDVVAVSAAGGYEVKPDPAPVSPTILGAERSSDDDRLYLRVAGDHTAGRLPEWASENELIRRYETTRSAIVRILQRAANEGWTERRPGRGWAFVPLLASELAYEQLYRYRIVVEPAAILEPSFRLNRPAIESCLDEQTRLFDSGGEGLTPIDVFETGSRFHQTVLECSNNRFFINGMTKANRVRRLMEYTKTLGSPHWLQRCRDHARIAELLLAGKRELASQLMRRHLEEGASEKML